MGNTDKQTWGFPSFVDIIYTLEGMCLCNFLHCLWFCSFSAAMKWSLLLRKDCRSKLCKLNNCILNADELHKFVFHTVLWHILTHKTFWRIVMKFLLSCYFLPFRNHDHWHFSSVSWDDSFVRWFFFLYC